MSVDGATTTTDTQPTIMLTISRASPTPALTPAAAPVVPMALADLSTLTAENAALRARVAALETKVNRCQTASADALARLDKKEKERKLAWRKYYVLKMQLTELRRKIAW